MKKLWERKNAGNQHFLFVCKCFQLDNAKIVSSGKELKTGLRFLANFYLFSANAYSLEWSIILSVVERIYGDEEIPSVLLFAYIYLCSAQVAQW